MVVARRSVRGQVALCHLVEPTSDDPNPQCWLGVDHGERRWIHLLPVSAGTCRQAEVGDWFEADLVVGEELERVRLVSHRTPLHPPEGGSSAGPALVADRGSGPGDQ